MQATSPPNASLPLNGRHLAGQPAEQGPSVPAAGTRGNVPAAKTSIQGQLAWSERQERSKAKLSQCPEA